VQPGEDRYAVGLPARQDRPRPLAGVLDQLARRVDRALCCGLARLASRSSYAPPLASAGLSHRVGNVVGYPPLPEMSDLQRREFHEALLDADSFEDRPGKWQAHLVVYPYDETDINPYNVSAAYLTSLPPHRRPELALKGAREIVVEDKPGDVMVFPGNRLWHLRRRPARAVNLYLKVNDFDCDPLGEDPTTAERRRATLAAVADADGRVDRLVPVLSRRLDTISREYMRDWQEALQARLWDDGPVMIDEQEFRLLSSIDGRRTMAELAGHAPRAALLRLAERGVVDLVSP
jgi:hypothetical protein